MEEFQISDTVLVAFITGTLTLMAGVYGELFKNFFARRHRQEEIRLQKLNDQLDAVANFLATVGELRTSSVSEALPLVHASRTVRQARQANSQRSRSFFGASRHLLRRKNDTTSYEVALDSVRLSMASAKLRADMHLAWQEMDLRLFNDEVRRASAKVQRALRDNSVYVGASISKPSPKYKGRSGFVLGEFDSLLDDLRETASRELQPRQSKR